MRVKTQLLGTLAAAAAIAVVASVATTLIIQAHSSFIPTIRLHNIVLTDEDGKARLRIRASNAGILLLSGPDSQDEKKPSNTIRVDLNSFDGPRITMSSLQNAQIFELGNIPIGDTPNLKGAERLIGIHVEAFNSDCPLTVDYGVFTVNGKAVRVMTPASRELCVKHHE